MSLPSYELRKKLNLKLFEFEIMEFDDKLIEKIKNTNVPMFRNFFQIFEEGLNIGTCGATARYLSYLFDDFKLIVNGKCKLLIGTKCAPMGEHSWLLVDGYIYIYIYMIQHLC